MRQIVFIAALALFPITARAQTENSIVSATVQNHILPRFQALAETSSALTSVAQDNCAADSLPLRAAYGEAFDAWILASHLRFGPSETNDRAFALAFWPDSRGVTPKTLQRLIVDQDPVAAGAESYAEVSIAARGFYALEFLLFDETLQTAGDAGYHCTLVQTVTADIAVTSAAIAQDWEVDYAARMLDPDSSATYRSEEDVLQEFFKALTTGLEFTSDTRLGRPLGTYDRPRPARAENWRSGRSARNVALSLAALGDLAGYLASNTPELAERLQSGFERTQSQLTALDDPVFAGVSDPQSRLKLEVVQQSIDALRAIIRQDLGPTLGVVSGFNALDGD